MIIQILPWNFQGMVDLNQFGLVGNGFVWKEKFLMEPQTWVDSMELWTYLICSWVGSTTCNFIKILGKEDMGTNLQKTWKEEFLSKEDIWEPICIKLEQKSLEQKRDGYPFVENLRKKSHDKSY